MTRISWDSTVHLFSQGISNGVLYVGNARGIPWNGLISVTEKGDDTSTSLMMDGQVFRNEVAPTTFAGTITAFMYPDEFEACIGVSGGITAQPKKPFSFTYRDNHMLHIVYNALASPSSDQYQSTGGNTNPVSFQWDFTTTPVEIPGGKPSAHLVVLTDLAASGALSALEDYIYGADATDPMIPDPRTLYSMFDEHANLRIVDNGDGTWTATDNLGSILEMLDGVTFQITWPSAVIIDADSYKISSL